MKRMIVASTDEKIKVGGSEFSVKIYRCVDKADTLFDFCSNLEAQITQIHPYDDAEYVWCKIRSGSANYYLNGHRILSEYIGEYVDYDCLTPDVPLSEIKNEIINYACRTIAQENAMINPVTYKD